MGAAATVTVGPRRGPGATGVALALLLALVSLALAAAELRTRGFADTWASDLAAVVLVATAAVLIATRSQPRTAWLLLATALTLGLSGLNGQSEAGWGGYWSMVGWTTYFWPIATILPVVLCYPGDRFTDRWSRPLALAMAVVVGSRLVTGPLWDPSRIGYDGPVRWLSYPGLTSNRASDLSGRVEAAVVIALLLATVVVLGRRWQAARGLGRRPTRAIVATGTALALTVVAVESMGFWWPATETVFYQLIQASLVLVAATPLVIMVVAVRSSWERARLVDALLLAGADASVVEATLRRALDDDALVLWLRVAGGWVDSRGRPQDGAGGSAPRPGTLERRTLTTSDGSPAVLVDLTPPSGADAAAVESVLTAAAVALEHSRLAVEREAHLAEVRASRSRVVEAGLAERRRLERDLHDGVQQHLLALSATLARVELADDPSSRGQAMNDARLRVAETMAEVRSLGRGIHPTALSQGGLAVALPRLEGVDAAVRVELDPTVRSGERLDPDVESAIWFSSAELVTNAVRHADADRIIVTAALTEMTDPRYRERGALLVVDVTSRAGVAEVARGLVALHDRVEALHGQVELGPRDGGTVVRVWVPLQPRLGTGG